MAELNCKSISWFQIYWPVPHDIQFPHAYQKLKTDMTNSAKYLQENNYTGVYISHNQFDMEMFR